MYEINAWWLILLVFTPFVLGLLVGLNRAKSIMVEMMLKKLDIDQIEKLMEDDDE